MADSPHRADTPSRRKRHSTGRDEATSSDNTVVPQPALAVRSSGELEGQILEIRPGTQVIGRQPNCELCIDDGFISARHAIVVRDDTRVTIQDADSANGTSVNGESLHRDQRALRSGDVVRVGRIDLVYLDGTETPPRRQALLRPLEVPSLRPPEPLIEVAREKEVKWDWKGLLSAATPSLTVGGVLFYTFVTIAYGRFYAALGIRPTDVGLSYVNTLAQSIGALLLFIFLLFGAIALSFLIALLFVRGPGWLALSWSGNSPKYRITYRTLAWLTAGALIGVIAWTTLLVKQAGTDAAEVRRGNPVSSHHFGPMTILATHADPVVIQPLSKVAEQPAIDALQSRHLLYLGQTGGIDVLYDSDSQRAVYLPESSVVLQVSNCATRLSPDPACRRFTSKR